MISAFDLKIETPFKACLVDSIQVFCFCNRCKHWDFESLSYFCIYIKIIYVDLRYY